MKEKKKIQTKEKIQIRKMNGIFCEQKNQKKSKKGKTSNKNINDYYFYFIVYNSNSISYLLSKIIRTN